MLGTNAGLIGAARTSRRGAAVGLWTPNEQVIYQRQNAWIGDANFDSVSLLLHMDGSNGSTTFIDSSKNALSVTANGNAQISTAQSKFGGASAAFDGTGDYLSSPNNSLFDFGSGDLTIEAWVYIASNSTPDNDGFRTANICNTWNTALPLSGWALNMQGSTTTTGTGINFDTWSSGNGTFFRATTTVSQNSWNHIAATISGGTRRIFLNGTLLTGTTTSSGSGYTQANSLGNPIRVGSTQLAGYPVALNGYIDDLRITKGVARYTANFTPPSAPFPDA